MQKQRIQNIIQKKCGDLEIYFNNGTIIQILIDCLPMHDECYRLIEFLPCYDSNKSKHFVVYCIRGDICVKNEWGQNPKERENEYDRIQGQTVKWV